MSGTGDYILGAIGVVGITLSMAIAGRTTRRAALPEWEGTPALLADAVLAIGILVVISEVLGLFGIFHGSLLFASCLIVGGGALRMEPMLIRAGSRVAHWEQDNEPDQRQPPKGGRIAQIELGVALVIALIVAAQWAGPTLLALDRGIYGGDSLWYHMPLAAHIAQTHSITGLLYTDPLYLNWFYPQVSELIHAGGIGLFGNDFLSPLINMAWLGLALFAGWCIGRPYGSGATSMAAVAAIMAANLLFSRQPGNANNDVVAIALFLSSCALLLNTRWPEARRRLSPSESVLLRAAGDSRRLASENGALPTGTLLVAGLAAGLALGTKLTVVPPVLALTAGVIFISPAGRRLRASGIWIGAAFVGGGYWYLRNLIASGNPFPWQDIGPIHHAEALQGRHPYSILHYATDTSVWGRYFTPALHERLGDLWPGYLALAVIAVLLVLWQGGRVERMLGVVAVLSFIAYLITPLSASGPDGMPIGFRLNIRYLAPGLTLALTLLAIPPSFMRGREVYWRVGTLALLAALTVASAGAVEEIDTGRIPGEAALALAVIALPVGLALLFRRGISPVPLAGIGLAAVIALAVFGRIAQKDYLDQRYSSTAPHYPTLAEHPGLELSQGLGAAYDWARLTHDQTIALSGTLGALYQYPFWGRDGSNDVRYIGQKGPRGSFDDITTCPEWIAAVNNGTYDYIVTSPTYNQDNPSADTAPPARGWLEHAGNVRHVAGANLVDVWQVTGPLDPLACVPGAPPGGLPPPATK